MKIKYKWISNVYMVVENTKEPEYIKSGFDIDTSNILIYIRE